MGCSPREARLAGSRRELVLERLTEAALNVAPGSPVLVIGNPFARQPGADGTIREAEEAAVRGVERAAVRAGVRFLGTAAPALHEEAQRDPSQVLIPPGASTPLSFMTERGAWDRIRAEHGEAKLWVSLIGVPADVGESRFWNESDGPRLALFLPDLRWIGGREAIRAALDSGRLAAVVFARPGAPPESEPMLGDSKAEFERRYLLLTRDTWEGVTRAWPGLVP